MKPKKTKAILRLSEQLSRRSFEVYLKLLRQLLDHHREHIFLKDLSDALRARDFPRVYALADDLSTQKYVDATSHFVANQFCLLIKKYPWPKGTVGLDPDRTARATFASAEKRVGLVNRKFRLLSHVESSDSFRREAGAARWWIRTVLGPTPNIRRIFGKCDFGDGASLGVHGNATHVLAKVGSDVWTVTPGALHYAFGGLMRNVHYSEHMYPRKGDIFSIDHEYAFAAYTLKTRFVDNNKISFVPKTAKTHRSIAVEPLLNGYVQKGIDLVLREKLSRFGLDLSTQEVNQRLAREGSADDTENGFVTIDLKSASDSISRELARYLLPEAWFRLMDRTRSPCYELDGVVKTYNKFCSMGNGFCFPLETLIFAAACVATGSSEPGVDFVVYGDDIIVRKRTAPSVLSLLRHWGFKANTDKTFLEGPFRESCGADWFGGQDVRPFTLDYALDSIENVFKFLNLTRRNERTIAFFSCVRERVIALLPDEFRFFRPFTGQADTGIDSTGDEHLKCNSCRPSQAGGWTWLEIHHSSVIDVNRLREFQDEPWLIGVALRGSKSLPHGSLKGLPEVALRRITQTRVVRKSRSSTSNWLPTPYA